MIINIEQLKKKFYPDNSKDGTLIFYNWLRQYVKKEFTVLNIGAGQTSKRKVRSLRNEVKEVIGVDIDEVVLQNEDLNKAIVAKKGEKLPFADNYFDLIWADYVCEHIEDPLIFLSEVRRVLKSGASFFFRTPNRYHYVSLIGGMTPHWFHELVANKARGLSSTEHDIYPTFYHLNSRNSILKNANLAGFKDIELRLIECDPSYLVFNPITFLIGVMYERFVNINDLLANFRANILGRLEK
jgi:SAM-dependent methyltransferase